MEAKHTGKAWRYGPEPEHDDINGHHFSVRDEESGQRIATINNAIMWQEAHARLIATAPELLEALEEMAAWYGHLSRLETRGIHKHVINKTRAAIAKAAGR